MRAEIWLGSNKAYCIDAVKRLDWSINERIIKITDQEGRTFETSPHNVVIIDHPTEKGGVE